MISLLLRIVAVVAGSSLAIQPLINARLRNNLNDPFWAALVSFIVGTIGLGVICIARRTPLPNLLEAYKVMPWWVWTGGLFGVVYVAISLAVVPRIGSATMVACIVFGMLLAALIIDHTGALGVPIRRIDTLRVAGAACVLLGTLLISR